MHTIICFILATLIDSALKKGQSKFAVIERFSFMEFKVGTLLEKKNPRNLQKLDRLEYHLTLIKITLFFNSPSFYFKREGI